MRRKSSLLDRAICHDRYFMLGEPRQKVQFRAPTDEIVTYQRLKPLASQATLALNATLTPDGAARPRMFRAAFRSAFS